MGRRQSKTSSLSAGGWKHSAQSLTPVIVLALGASLCGNLSSMTDSHKHDDPTSFDIEDDQIEPWSPDFRTELAQQLSELAPEAVADGKIDVEKLRELLEGDASDTSERFGLFWPGKKRAMRAAQTPTSATLAPDFKNSKNWDETQNVFIEGDNLEVLKILQKHYYGKIKMIYIDPPYNTGKDFVYPDNYREGLDNYLEWSKQVNEEGQKLSSNTDTGGRLHTNWLNMMYPRLKLARNLLTADGLIFISIDDKEHAHLRSVLDEVFGVQNFEGSIHWRRRHNQPNDPTKLIGLVAEHILVYSRDSEQLKLSGVGKLPLSGDFKNPDNDPRGDWNSKPWKVASGQGGSRYQIVTPTGKVLDETWMGDRSSFERLLADNRIIFPKNGDGAPRKKQFKFEREAAGQSATNWFPHDQFGSNQEATSALSKLMGGKRIFDNPKPSRLIKSLVRLGALKDKDIVLDFFAGSGTTAHAVMELNAEDGGARQHILVQLPEPTPAGSIARASGYTTISEISRDRICRVGEEISEEYADRLKNRERPLDVGFRAFKLTETNFAKWHLTADAPMNEVEQHLLDIRSSANDAASQEALLTELLLKQGMSLTEPLKIVNVSGLTCHAVIDSDSDGETDDSYVLLAYLDEHTKPTLEQLRAIVELEPARLVVLEDAFAGDDQLKTNLKQMCVTNDIELKTA